MTSKLTEHILRSSQVIAVIGLSRSPSKDSHSVAKYLQTHGYRVIPVNPYAHEILGETCYPNLRAIPATLQKTIDLVDIFRPSEEVPRIVDDVITLKQKNGKPKAIWMQLGITHDKAERSARAAGLDVVANRCTRTEHSIVFYG